jgi:hypothetical protein
MLNTENPTRNDDAATVQIPRPRPESSSSPGSSSPGSSSPGSSSPGSSDPRAAGHPGSHGGRIMAALRRVIRTARNIHGEMARASALMFPQPRPRDDARRDRDPGRVA